MPTLNIPFKRGTTAQNNAFTGAAGEITIDTTLRTLRVHDGVKAGGEPLLRAADAPSGANVVGATIVTTPPTTAEAVVVDGGVLQRVTLANLASVLSTLISGSSASVVKIAAEALPARSLVYIRSDNTCALANATFEGKESIGFVNAAVAQGASATIRLSGNIISGLSGLTPGARYFMGATDGAIVTEAAAAVFVPGNVILPIGTAISSTELLFQPSFPITL